MIRSVLSRRNGHAALILAFFTYWVLGPIMNPLHENVFSDGAVYIKLSRRMLAGQFGTDLGDVMWPIGMPVLLASVLTFGSVKWYSLFSCLMLIAGKCMTIASIRGTDRASLVLQVLVALAPGTVLLASYPFSEIPSFLFLSVALWTWWTGKFDAVSLAVIGLSLGLGATYRAAVGAAAVSTLSLLLAVAVVRSDKVLLIRTLFVGIVFSLPLIPQALVYSKALGTVSIQGLHPSLNLLLGWQIDYRCLQFEDRFNNGVIVNRWCPDGLRNQPIEWDRPRVYVRDGVKAEDLPRVLSLVPAVIARNASMLFWSNALFPVDEDLEFHPALKVYTSLIKLYSVIVLVSILISLTAVFVLSPPLHLSHVTMCFLLFYLFAYIVSIGALRYRVVVDEHIIALAANTLYALKKHRLDAAKIPPQP